MGAPARRQRMSAARAAVAAAFAVVIVTVIVGFGATDEAPAATSPVAAPALAPPAAAPVLSAPVREGTGPAPQARPAVADPEPVVVPPSDGPAPESVPSSSAPPSPPPVTADPRAVAAPALVPGTPCTATARACVDLAGGRAWLIDDGTVVRGPVTIMSGSLDDPTPVGTFTVQWKAEEYTSREYLVQMPYSVFFADGGIAFHEGSQDTFSAGCVKLVHDDAVEWFRFLQVGDEVQVR